MVPQTFRTEHSVRAFCDIQIMRWFDCGGQLESPTKWHGWSRQRDSAQSRFDFYCKRLRAFGRTAPARYRTRTLAPHAPRAGVTPSAPVNFARRVVKAEWLRARWSCHWYVHVHVCARAAVLTAGYVFPRRHTDLEIYVYLYIYSTM